jgi:hypothetical protein
MSPALSRRRFLSRGRSVESMSPSSPTPSSDAAGAMSSFERRPSLRAGFRSRHAPALQPASAPAASTQDAVSPSGSPPERQSRWHRLRSPQRQQTPISAPASLPTTLPPAEPTPERPQSSSPRGRSFRERMRHLRTPSPASLLPPSSDGP